MRSRVPKCLPRQIVAFAAILLLNAIAAAQQAPLRSINYRLSMSRPVSHLFEVTIEVELPEQGTPDSLDFQMPRWSPGRYAVFDFAKNVQEVYAASGICPPKQEAGNTDCLSPGPASREPHRQSNLASGNERERRTHFQLQGFRQRSLRHFLSTRHAACQL